MSAGKQAQANTYSLAQQAIRQRLMALLWRKPGAGLRHISVCNKRHCEYRLTASAGAFSCRLASAPTVAFPYRLFHRGDPRFFSFRAAS